MSSVLYEMLYIVDASLEEETIQQLVKEVKTTILSGGGVIQKESNWGRRPLSYPIKKKTEGVYINIDMEGPADLPEKINEYIYTHAGILRHLTLKVPKARLLQQKLDEERKEKELQAAREAREAEAAAANAPSAAAESDSRFSKPSSPNNNLDMSDLDDEDDDVDEDDDE